MQELYELKEKLLKELKSLSNGEVSYKSLDAVDKLSHALKNLTKVIDECEGGYSSDGSYRGMSRYSRDGESNDGEQGSYKRDSMGRYSRDGYSGHVNMESELRNLMHDVPDERTRQAIQRLLKKMEM